MKFELRGFMAGLLCGGILIAVVWAGSVWWKSSVEHSPEDAAMYDACLAGQNGNMAACDAYMRVDKRLKSQDDALATTLKEASAKMLAAGHSKREAVKWVTGSCAFRLHLREAPRISLID